MGKGAMKEWVRGAKIGKGETATVFAASIKSSSKRFAVKSTDRNDLEKRLALENERKILKSCKSPYIIRYLGCATSDKVPQLQLMYTFDLFIELLPRGTIMDHWKRNGCRLEEPIVAAYARDVLRGLQYLHANGIIHGDIKCENLLVGLKNIKLCDFGSAKFEKDGDLILAPRPDDYKPIRIYVTGTRGWMAPEVEDELEQGKPSDIYSLGCTIVEMCTGKPPQKDPVIFVSERYTDDGLDDDDVPICTVDVPPNYSEECRQFVESCLALDPQDRPTATECLEHPWIVNAPPYLAERAPPQRPKARSVITLSNVFRKKCGINCSC